MCSQYLLGSSSALRLLRCVINCAKTLWRPNPAKDLPCNQPIRHSSKLPRIVRSKDIVTLHPDMILRYHDGSGGVAFAGVDKVGDGVPLHPDDALDDRFARVLRGDHQHDVPRRDPAEPHADPVHRHRVARQVQGRQHAGAPH
uniref:Uncharacterized protein n=1 Tax=Zea mays TaxID=4577 RepID=C4J6U3_MAIZE|nr:unknown [Zea mays]